MHSTRTTIGNERGATLVLIALSIVMMLGMGALAIDLSMMRKARGDAQRAADAAALAGASAYINYPTATPGNDTARARAIYWATQNKILSTAITAAEVIRVDTSFAQDTVGVTIKRAGISTWLARVLGINSGSVTAHATAIAATGFGGASTCVKPFAVPDIWNERATDTDGDHVWDANELWKFNTTGPNADVYAAFGANGATGYGSAFRNLTGIINDFGRQMILKPDDPSGTSAQQAGASSFFWLYDPNGSGNGASAIRANIADTLCADGISVNTGYPIIPGNKVGPIGQGVGDLVSYDANAVWNAGTNSVAGSRYSDWHNSPRVIKVGLFNPALLNTATSTITFNNIALFWLDPITGNGANTAVTGRFLGFAAGAPGGGTTGALIKTLRLIK